MTGSATGPAGDVDPIVRAQLDRAEIEELVYRWAAAADAGRPSEAARVFVEDCVVDYGDRSPAGAIHGRAQYEALMRQARSNEPVDDTSLITSRTRRCHHHFTNVSIRFATPDEAIVQSYAFTWVEQLAGDVHLTWSVFDDLVVRTAGGWQIRRRRNRLMAEEAR
jgi:hypothetical protein